MTLILTVMMVKMSYNVEHATLSLEIFVDLPILALEGGCGLFELMNTGIGRWVWSQRAYHCLLW